MLKFFNISSNSSSKHASVATPVDNGKPKTWADGPYELIKLPASYLDVSSHFAIYMANEMAIVHNLFIRGFNAVLLQGSFVSANRSLVPSFLIFLRSLVRAIHHHHQSEERVGFPAIEREIGIPGFIDVALEQYAAFHDGLEELERYVDELVEKPEAFDWGRIKGISDGLMPALETHLREEVEQFIQLKKFGEEGMRKAWHELEETAKEAGIAGFYDVFPVALVCHDKTYGGGAGANFPPLPVAMLWVIKNTFARYYGDAWKFGPSDINSNPRPLQFVE